MTMQLRLPIDRPKRLEPSTEREEPAFWVRRLRVLRELKADDDAVVRDVQLRRGLNIIWAPPQQATERGALFGSGMAGHTAGKTTFCRLMRYALGEHGFAAEGTRRRIRGKFPYGWVVAEVVVDKKLWTVARPFGIGPHPFCIEDGNIEQATAGDNRLDYQVFLNALNAVTVRRLNAAYFPTSDEPVRWDHILPWLTRDQECRFADFLEWRHSSSDSESPSLGVDERQFLVRSVLGLMTDEERQEQKKNALLVNRRKEATPKEPLFSHQAEADHARVERLLGIELQFPPTGLFALQARSELEHQKAELARREQELVSFDQRTPLQAVLEKKVQIETNARRDLQDADIRLTAEKDALVSLIARANGESQASLLSSLPPAREYCNVPMRVAREHGCPLAASRPIDLAERRSERTATDELSEQRKLVEALEKAVEECRRVLAIAESETHIARRELMTAATHYDEARGQLLEKRAQLAQIGRLVLDAEEAWNNSVQYAAAVKKLSVEIEASYARQEQLRQSGREALGRFSAIYDFVVRALLGDEVEARVDTSGRSLSLVVNHNGERDSAALSTVKLLAFDLAALTYSCEGQGYFPRFLLHDGPREADMSPDIYERLFYYARQLEDGFKGELSFQYILTTTTPPPAEFLSERWLRLRLAGTPANERFLRTDL